MTTPAPLKRPRGFATFSPEKRRAVAVLGGIAAHAAGTAHEWTSETGRAAGRKGGAGKWATDKQLQSPSVSAVPT